MNNPFLSNGVVMPTASINTVKIMGLGNLPVNPDIINKTAKELLCAETVSILINRFLEKTGIESLNPFKTIEELSDNGESEIRKQANAVLMELGYNLGYLLLALKRGEPENRLARSNWNAEHWEYWNRQSKIDLAGGLAQGKFGKKMLEYTAELFNKLNIVPYETAITRDADMLPLIGAARLTLCDSVAFDFGHSYIKSCVIKQGNPAVLYVQDKISARHVIADNDDESYTITDAHGLDDFISEVIISTLNNAGRYINTSNTDTIVASIANYVSNGHIAQRGSYRKLALLADNYGAYLSAKLSNIFNRQINIRLVHDSTSAAIAVKQPNCDKAVITMGTSLGVGFTDCINELPRFEYVLGC